jgi:hypothetical protein
MKPKEAKKELEKLIKTTGRSLDSHTPETAITTMLGFYSEVRAKGCPIKEDGDMLLYQWGTGTGKSFYLDITRQFILAGSDSDDGMSQLSLTLHFNPNHALRRIKDGNEWCYSPKDLPKFRKFIERSAPYRAVATSQPKRVELDYSPI